MKQRVLIKIRRSFNSKDEYELCDRGRFSSRPERGRDAHASASLPWPLSVEVGGETFKDQAEISSEEFYDKMIASDTLPKSSQPSPSEFMDIYNALASEGADEIIAIHIAAVLSGTSESSNLAANQVEVPVEVIDSFNACSGQGLLALLACEMRDAGASAQECAQAIKDARAHTRFFIACGTLDNLLAGGRLSAEEVDAATLLDIKPMMSFDERGVLKAFDKAKGMNGVIKKYVEKLKEITEDEGIQRVRFCHTRNEKGVEKLKRALEQGGNRLYRLRHLFVWCNRFDASCMGALGMGSDSRFTLPS